LADTDTVETLILDVSPHFKSLRKHRWSIEILWKYREHVD